MKDYHLKTMNVWLFLILAIVYAIVSFTLVTFTTGGWTGLLIIAVALLFYLTIPVVILTITINKSIAKKTKVRVSLLTLFLLLVSQGLLYLFMPGDGGDTGGSYLFFERIFEQSSIFYSFFKTISVLGLLVPFAYLALIGRVLFEIIKFSPPELITQPKQTTAQPKQTKSILKIQILITVIILGIFFISLFAFLRNSANCEQSNNPDGCYYDKAIASENINFSLETCNKIMDLDSIGSCYSVIAKKNNDPTVCNSLSDQTALDRCILGLASYGFNPNCYQIKNINTQNLCQANSAKTAEDCSNIEDIDIKNRCFASIAIEQMDYQICNNVSNNNIYLKNDCFESLAIIMKDVKICQFIQPEKDQIINRPRNDCIFEVAFRLHNPDLCELIDINDQEEKDRCLNLK